MKRKPSLRNIWNMLKLQSEIDLVGQICSGIMFSIIGILWWRLGINSYETGDILNTTEEVMKSVFNLYYSAIGLFWVSKRVLVNDTEYKKSQEILKVLPITKEENILSKFGGILLISFFAITPYITIYLFDASNRVLLISRGVLSLVCISILIIISIVNITRVDKRVRKFYKLSRVLSSILLAVPMVVYLASSVNYNDELNYILNKLIMSSFIENLGGRYIGVPALIMAVVLFEGFNYLYIKYSVLREERGIYESN